MAGVDEVSLDEEVQSVLSNQQEEAEVCSNKSGGNKTNPKKKSQSKQSNVKTKAVDDRTINIASLGYDQSKSAFIPYQPTTILTNLQRGNMETETTVVSPELNLFQLVAQGEVFACDIDDQVNDRDENGMTLLMWASAYGQINTAKMLINKGADVNLTGSKQGESALHLASANGHMEIVKQLIHAGARLNHVDCTGSTALMYAAHNNQASCVNYLLNAGADMTLENEMWQSALSLAIAKNSYQAITILERHILRMMQK